MGGPDLRDREADRLKLKQKFTASLQGKKVVCLDVPDRYQFICSLSSSRYCSTRSVPACVREEGQRKRAAERAERPSGRHNEREPMGWSPRHSLDNVNRPCPAMNIQEA